MEFGDIVPKRQSTLQSLLVFYPYELLPLVSSIYQSPSTLFPQITELVDGGGSHHNALGETPKVVAMLHSSWLYQTHIAVEGYCSVLLLGRTVFQKIS